MGGVPVALVEGGVVYYVRTDHIGRPVFATDGSGAKVWEATYLPFGEVLATSGNPIALRFPGQWFQAESGLHQNWMRDYDPTTGRYMQADPLGLVDGASVYGYVWQNPGRYVDLTGQCGEGVCIGGAIAGAYRLFKYYRLGRSVANSIDPAAAGAAAAAGQNAQADAVADSSDCGEDDPCGPLTRGQAYRQAQAMVGIPRDGRGGFSLPVDTINPTSRGPNSARILSEGGRSFGRGTIEGLGGARIEDHPDGHPHMLGEGNHGCPHLHVYNRFGFEIAQISYKRGT